MTGIRGAVGGASGEAGSRHRNGVAAYFVAHGLAGAPVHGVALPESAAVPTGVYLETPDDVDDVVVRFGDNLHVAYVQAKVSAPFGPVGSRPFRDALEQFVQLSASEDFAATTTRLVLAVGTSSRSLTNLRIALDRRREKRAGAEYRATAAQEKAISDIGKHLKDIAPSHRDSLLEALVVLPLNTSDSGMEALTAAAARLEARVVSRGDGLRGFRELRDLAQEFASRRLGYPVSRWWQTLSDRSDIWLHPSTAHFATKAGSAASLDRYREIVTGRGERLNLRSVGLDLAPFKLAHEEAVPHVLAPEAGDEDHSVSLFTALRRRRRLLMSGRGGVGKTTALWRLAHFLLTAQDSPLPLLARLDAIDSAPGAAPLLDQIVEQASSLVPTSQRSGLREAIGEHLAEGRVALLLDGLDQLGARASTVIADLEQQAAELPSTVEVVVATRPSTAPPRGLAGFHAVELEAPTDLKETLLGIALAVAEAESSGPIDRDVWARRRVKWVWTAVDRDKVLGETPLLPLLLLACACQRSVESLPRTRADALMQVVEDLIDRWEIDQRLVQQAGLDPLDREQLRQSAHRTYCIISHALAETGSGPVSPLRMQIGDELAREWGFSASQSAALTETLLRFWDTSGIFELREQDTVMRVPVRLFAEIGEARLALTMGPEEALSWQSAWLKRLIADGAGDEILALTASKSHELRLALLSWLQQTLDERGLDVALRACADSEMLEADDQGLLLSVVRAYLATLSDRAWELAKQLSNVRFLPPVQDHLLAAIESSIDDQHLVPARALCLAKWGRRGPDVDERLREALAAPRPTSPTSADTRTGLRISLDSGFDDARLAAARALLPGDSEAVTLVTKILQDKLTSGRFFTEGRQLLLDHGLPLPDPVYDEGRLLRTWQRDSARWNETWSAFLGATAGLCEPSALSYEHRRFVDELADLVATLRIVNMAAVDFQLAMTKTPDSVVRLLRLVAVLGAFDRPILAAQAALAAKEDGHATRLLLFDHPCPRKLTQWKHVEDPDAAATELAELLLSGPWIRRISAYALFDGPRPSKCRAALESVMEVGAPRARFFAAILQLTGAAEDAPYTTDALAQNADPAVRRSAVALCSDHAGSPEHESILKALAQDPDAGVRTEALKQLYGNMSDEPPELRTKREATPPEAWLCMRCDHTNPPQGDTCQRCRIVGSREPN